MSTSFTKDACLQSVESTKDSEARLRQARMSQLHTLRAYIQRLRNENSALQKENTQLRHGHSILFEALTGVALSDIIVEPTETNEA